MASTARLNAKPSSSASAAVCSRAKRGAFAADADACPALAERPGTEYSDLANAGYVEEEYYLRHPDILERAVLAFAWRNPLATFH